MLTKTKLRECNIKYSILQAMNMFVSAVLSVFIVPLLSSQGFTVWQIGILMAVKYGSTIVFSVFYASLADRLTDYITNKGFIAIFCIAGIVITILHLYVPMDMLRGVLVFIGYGASFCCIGPFTDAFSSQYSANGVQINYAFARAMGSMFWAFAGLILGCLTSRCSSYAILWLQVVALVLCLMAVLIMPAPNSVREKLMIKKNKISNVNSVPGMLVQNPFYIVFLVASFFLMTGVNLTMGYMAYTVSGVGGTTFDLGMCGFVLGFFEIFAGFYFKKFLNFLGTRRVIFLAMTGMALRVGMLVISRNMAMVYAAQVFELIGCMLWAGNVQLVREEIAEQDWIKGQTLINSVQTGFSMLAASVLGGYIMERFENVFFLHSTAFGMCMLGLIIYVYQLSMIKSKQSVEIFNSSTNKTRRQTKY